MGSRYEIEVKITSAKDLKNVNWRYGPLKPYAVVWVDPNAKCSTKVDKDGDTSPYWNEKLVIPLYSPIDESTIYIDIVHAGGEEDTKPLIGSAKIPLSEVDDVGIGGQLERTLQLKRPSGRPQGKLEVEVTVRDPRYRARDAYYASPYGVPPPPNPYYSYGGAYGAPIPPYPQPAAAGSYGQPAYGYGQPVGGYEEEKKKSKFGMGTGLAVGAVAGALGGLAIAEGIDQLEDNIAEDAAEKVEEDLAGDDCGYGDEDF